MEREILLTGIGGQGVQLAAEVLARAATREQRHVMTLGTYGGTMRGGNTDACIVIADTAISTPPLVSRAWAGFGMHPRYWEPVSEKLRPSGVAALNSSLFAEFDGAREDVTPLRVDTDALATEADAPMGGALVLAAAFSAATVLVTFDSLVEAMNEALPPYRRQHAEANTRALHAGWAAVETPITDAWNPGATT